MPSRAIAGAGGTAAAAGRAGAGAAGAAGDATGAAAGTAGVTLSIGGTNIQVQYAGGGGGFPGLDQVNAVLPASLAGKGNVTIQLTAASLSANTVNFTIQ